MRLLADENVHGKLVALLRSCGFDVEWIAESMPGLPDDRILGRPDIGDLVLLTFDRDFGDLIFHRGFPSPRCILYSRVGRTDPHQAADRIRLLIEKGLPERHMIRIARDGERLKPFPDGADNG